MALIKYSFWIPEAQRDALRFVARRDGVRESEQIRRGLALWFKSKGVKLQAAGKRAGTRKRS